MRILLAIDPGPIESAFVVMYQETNRIIRCEKWDNEKIRIFIKQNFDYSLVIEMIASYGMPVGKEVFDTCVWIGRFIEAHNGEASLLYRKEICLHLCNSPRAKDANIRQALIDKFGKPGTKKNPGPTFGISGDVWSALAVAITYKEKECSLLKQIP